MGRLTEANYLSRKVKLREQMAAARAAHQDAAFRYELGESDEAAVAKAKAEISALEDRVAGLDAAWERTKRETEADRQEQEAKERQAAMAAVDEHLKARAKAAVEMGKIAKQLGEAWQRFEAAGTGVLNVARPYAPSLGVEGFTELRELLFGDFHSAKPVLGSAMVDAGLVLSGHCFVAQPFRQQSDGLAEFVEKKNELTHALLASRLGEEKVPEPEPADQLEEA